MYAEEVSEAAEELMKAVERISGSLGARVAEKVKVETEDGMGVVVKEEEKEWVTVKKEEAEAEDITVTECPLFRRDRGCEHLKGD